MGFYSAEADIAIRKSDEAVTDAALRSASKMARQRSPEVVLADFLYLGPLHHPASTAPCFG
jgi:hypothetical protein